MTKLGKGVLLLAIGLFIPAINTGINSLYLVTSLLISLLIISIFVSKNSTKNLSIKRFVPDEIFQDTVFPVRISLKNKGRSRYLLVIEDGVEKPQDALHLIEKVKPGAHMDFTYLYKVAKRGIWKVRFCQVKSSFPFGLVENLRRYPLESEILILPKPLADYQFSISPLYGRTFGRGLHSAVHGLGMGEDFYRLDEYRSGDSTRWIHWRSSAKRDQLMVRRFEKEGQGNFSIVLNDSKEYAVRLAATVAYHLFKRNEGFQLIAWDSTEGLRVTPYAQGQAHLMDILRILATVKQIPIPHDIMKNIEKYTSRLSTVIEVTN